MKPILTWLDQAILAKADNPFYSGKIKHGVWANNP